MTDVPTLAAEQAIHAVHAALAPRFAATAVVRTPVYRHYEDEELGFGPLYERVSFRLEPGGFPIWCSTDRSGANVTASFRGWVDGRDPAGPYALVFDGSERAQLRAHGWRGDDPWTASWAPAQTEQICAALALLESVSPRVLLPEHLPPGTSWPWPDLLFHVLLAEVVGSEGQGPTRVLLTCKDGTSHRVRVGEGSEWERLWQAWRAHPPELPRFRDAPTRGRTDE